MATQIVTKASATFGLAGTREVILPLDADHSTICKFDFEVEEDLDNLETVENNLAWLYGKCFERLADFEKGRRVDEALIDQLRALPAPSNPNPSPQSESLLM